MSLLVGIKGIDVKELLRFFVSLLPLKIQIKLRGYYHLGYWLNLSEPKTFNEKIQQRKLLPVNQLFVICSDKKNVRDYVSEKIGQEYLIPLLYAGVSITTNQLKGFGPGIVAKATHDSGNVHIIKDISVNYEEIYQELTSGFQIDYGKKSHELWYSDIVPHIIVEKLLVNKQGGLPEDYKFHVFNDDGQFKVVLQVDYDRFSDHSRSFYNENLDLLPFSIKFQNYQKCLDIEKSTVLKMFELAKLLGSDFNYVRVDLYNVDGVIYFGELTFAHGGGYEKVVPRKYDLILGNYWQLAKA